MTTVAQTPGTFLRGGGSGFFSARCVKALAECGLEPEDFGSYEHVKGRIRAAKRDVLEHKLAKARGENPPDPSARTKLLASSDAGHLRQNSLFQRERGNSCQNEQPRSGHPGAPGYHHDLAPCGPHPSGTGKCKAGTTHWAQAQVEASVREGKKPGDPVSAQEISQVSKETSKLTAKGLEDKAQGQKLTGWTKTRRDKEAELRAASVKELDKNKAGQAKAPTDPTLAVADAGTAEECIEQFADLGMEAMRQQVMQDYSEENFAKTKRELEAAETAAAKKKAEADAAFKKALEEAKAAPKGKGRWDEVNRAGLARSQANQDHQQAKAANGSANCLRQQVQQMKAAGTTPGSEMSGSVPGWGKSAAARDKYGTQKDIPSDETL